jgi:hypothetical protein
MPTFTVTVNFTDAEEEQDVERDIIAVLVGFEGGAMQEIDGYVGGELVDNPCFGTGVNGTGTVVVQANDDITPANTYWFIDQIGQSGPWVCDVDANDTADNLHTGAPVNVDTGTEGGHTHSAYAPKANPTFTGQALFGSGLTSAPGIAFSADPDTGFYWENVAGLFPTIWAAVGGITRWGIANGLASFFQGGSEATLGDGTGHLQIGPSAAQNLGIDANEIQSRSGGVAQILALNPHGGNVQINGNNALTTTHEAAADPHPGYLLESDYQAIPDDEANPGQVTGLAAYPSFNQALLTWTARTEVDMIDGYGNYQIQVDGTSSAFSNIIYTLRTDGNSIVLHNLDFEATYWVRVRAIDAHGNQGTFSSTVSFTTIPLNAQVIDVWALEADQYIRSSDYDGTDYATNDSTTGGT